MLEISSSGSISSLVSVTLNGEASISLSSRLSSEGMVEFDEFPELGTVVLERIHHGHQMLDGGFGEGEGDGGAHAP